MVHSTIHRQPGDVLPPTLSTDPFSSIRAAAMQCYEWGANVSAIGHGDKRPLHAWKHFQQQRQTPEVVADLPWQRAAGYGVIHGIGGWRAFDLDGCPSFEPAARLLAQLGLPHEYAWIVRSGSGNGWQVWFRCYADLPPGVLPSKKDNAGVFWGWPADESFNHLELRWQHCQTILPPSQHPSGPGYQWLDQPPDTPPAEVSIGHVLAAVFAVAQVRPREENRLPPAQSQPHQQETAEDPDDQKEQIRRRFDLVAFARRHFGGEMRVEDGQVRVLGNGGLLINPETGLWYCFRDQLGGDAIDLAGYALYGSTWSRTDKQMFREALQQAADFAGVDLTSRRNGHHAEEEHSPQNGHSGSAGLSRYNGTGRTTPSSAPIDEDHAPIHQTDLGNARRLLKLYGEDLRYVPAWGLWLIWDGTRWIKDETGEIDRLARKTIAFIYEEASRLDDPDERKALAKWALSSESRTRLENMVALARQEPGIPFRHDQLDADPLLLNCLNGTIDLRCGELLPHRRDDLLTKRIEVAYDPQARCPTWLAFLHRVMDGNDELIDFLQRAVGYTLTGDIREQCLFFMYGTGRNGKSTFTETLMALLGDYQQKAPTEMLMARSAQGGIPNDIARLQGARLVVTAEVEEGRRLAESLVKDLTGGDTIVARFLRQEYFQFKPTHKIWMYGNHKPLVRGTDEGIWRRLHLIPFTVRIPDSEQDPDLPARLQAELPGILAWAVQGALLWHRSRLKVPAAVRQATAAYRSEMDVVGAFIEECCIAGSGYEAMAGSLYSAYTAWCEETGETPLNQRRFGMQLSERGFERRRSTGNRWRWSGIGLRDDTRSDPLRPGPRSPASDPSDPSDPLISIPLKGLSHDGNSHERVTQVTWVTRPNANGSEAIAEPSPQQVCEGTIYQDARLEQEIRQLLAAGQWIQARNLAKQLHGNLVKRELEQLISQAERHAEEGHSDGEA